VDWEGHSCYRCKRACKISMVNLLAASNCMHPPAPCCMAVGTSYSLKARPFSHSLSHHFGVMIFLQAIVCETQAGTKGLGIYEARIEQWWPLESSMHPQRTFCWYIWGISEYGWEAPSELHKTVFTIIRIHRHKNLDLDTCTSDFNTVFRAAVNNINWVITSPIARTWFQLTSAVHMYYWII